MKYLIAVISCEKEPFITLENEGVRKTWAGVKDSGMDIVYYYGVKNRNEICGDKVYLDCEDTYDTMPIKAMLFFEKILEVYQDLEYIFFTNLSSYVRLDKISSKFQSITDDKFYSGVIGYCKGMSFASGAGFFISRSLLAFIVKNKDKLNTSVMGDVAYGDLLVRSGIKIIPQNRFDIESPGQLDTVVRSNIEDHYHFRCKQKNRNDDILVMKRIHTLLGY